MKTNKLKKLNYKLISIIAIILIVIFIILAICLNKDSKLKFNDFERISIYGYLENNVLDVFKLYQLSGKIEYNETEIFQGKLKQALDNYFANSSEKEVSTSTILGLIDSDFVPESLDFNGIIVSDYEYNSEKNVFVVSKGSYSNISGIESSANNIDFSENKTVVKSIEKSSGNTYKVVFDIINVIHNDTVEDSGEVIISVKDNTLNIDSCIIND